MTAPLHVLDKDLGVSPETARPVTEAVWFAWRDRMGRRATALGDIRNGVWWTDDGKKVVSLATGTGLHAFGEMDFETYMIRGSDAGRGVCCHGSFEEAETCALVFFVTGHWCWANDEDDDA